MAYNNIEIEIKFPLLNAEAIKIFLDSGAKIKLKNNRQKDTYYVPAHRDFFAPQYPYEWFRLREAGNGANLTYKHFYPENAEKTDYCDEFESKVENPEAVKKMLAALDFKPMVVVDKSRDTWLLENVEIAIDEVRDLGTYIELEATLDYPDAEQAKKHLYNVLNKLGAQVGTEDLRGYPYLIWDKEKNK